MALRALLPGSVLGLVAFGVAFVVSGPLQAVAALSGAALVTVSFFAYASALGWARRISPTAVQAVALGGWLVRVALIFGALFAWSTVEEGAAAFGLTAIAVALAIAVYEAKLVLGGLYSPSSDPRSPEVRDATAVGGGSA